MHWMKPSVNCKPCHLPNEQTVFVAEDQNVEDAKNKKEFTELTQWFKLNQEDDFARTLLYADIPEHYRWVSKKWQPRKTAEF